MVPLRRRRRCQPVLRYLLGCNVLGTQFSREDDTVDSAAGPLPANKIKRLDALYVCTRTLSAMWRAGSWGPLWCGVHGGVYTVERQSAQLILLVTAQVVLHLV